MEYVMNEEKILNRGKLENMYETAETMLNDGCSDELIAKYTKLPIAAIKKLRSKLNLD